MKKGRIIAAALAAAMLVTGVTGVKAEEQTATTNVGIGFTSDSTQPGGTDALAISWFPTDLQFGNNNTAMGTLQTFGLSTTAKDRWIEVKDERLAGNISGTEWSLSAELSELTAGANTLSGVTLKMNRDAKLYNNTGNLSAPHTLLPEYLGNAAATATSFSLQATTSQVIMEQDQQVAVNERVAMHLTDIQLEVAGAQTQGAQYTGTVTWTLNDVI